MEKGVISGTSETTLSPKDNATRAECAVILQRYHELLNAKPEPQPSEPAPTEPPVTEPPVTEPQPEPEKPEHVHNWVHTHHDEVGHWEGENRFVCTQCGWECTDSMAAKEGMDIISYWTLYHQRPMLQEKDEQHSYYTDGDRDYIVDAPAYDEWVCDCGEVTRTDPTVG